MTSTPNGTESTGAFFYQMIQNAINSDELFEIDAQFTKEDETNNNLIYEKFVSNADDIMKSGHTNGFVYIRYHYSEDPTKTPEWMEEQRKQMNYEKRRINQEYEIQFVGSLSNPFDDDILDRLAKSVIEPINYINLPHSTRLKQFKEIDPNDYYLIGVDTASSLDNCYSAIEIYGFKDFEQVGELAIRLGSLKQYAEIVIAVANHFVKYTNGRVILCIENNSIGKAIVEAVVDTDLVYFLYHEKDKVDAHGIVAEWGINTNSKKIFE